MTFVDELVAEFVAELASESLLNSSRVVAELID
jgi:hypothetical protein